MIKRIISILLSFAICVGLLPVTAYAKESDAFELYQNAVQATVGAGSWTEDLTMTADMVISYGNTKTKTKVTLNSLMDVSDYTPNDFSKLQMSGSASMGVMGQSFVWDVQYENGVAHYRYTEPDQMTADIEMDPGCFNFNTLTPDMLEDAKISGKYITFTIPEGKMEAPGIAATNLMPGIDNMDYDDIDVEMTINKTTGTIDTIVMTFHASLTYQGYDAEVDYTIDYQFTSLGRDNQQSDSGESNIDFSEMESGLIVFSDYTDTSIRKDSTITLSVGIVIDGKQVEDISGITFQVEDSSILKIVDSGEKNNFRYVKFKGIKEGTTYVLFSDSKTGYTAKVPVTVYTNNYHSYTLSSVPPARYIEKYPTNFYNVNGLYIDSYIYTVNEDQTATVSFNVYNTNYSYGVVEVLDSEGKVTSAVLIKKMEDNNTSIKGAVIDNIGCLIRDFGNGTAFSYRQESGFSKETSVTVEVPQNGYIKICTDPMNSFILALVNGVDILMSAAELAGEIKDFSASSKMFTEELTLKLVKDRVWIEHLRDGSNAPKKLLKNIAAETLLSPKVFGNFIDTITANFAQMDLDKIVAETAWDYGWDMGEEVYKFLAGPIGEALDGIFFFGKLQNVIYQADDFIKWFDVGSIYIQNQGGGIRSSQQITVESETDFSDEAALSVFTVKLDSELLDMIEDISPEIYEAITEGVSYTYNISLMENGAETQPDGKVTVYIPIPEDLQMYAYLGQAKIYRVEEDGSMTEMDVEIKDGCFVFETEHFSLYSVVGFNVLKNPASIGIIAGIIAGIAGLILILISISSLQIKSQG